MSFDAINLCVRVGCLNGALDLDYISAYHFYENSDVIHAEMDLPLITNATVAKRWLY